MRNIFQKLRPGINLQGCKEAFTLIEMVIAITVFTVFIGFVMSTYLAFHRAEQEAGAQRVMILEAQSVMAIVMDSIKDNKINYAAYRTVRSWGGDILGSAVAHTYDFGFGSDVLSGSDLHLVSSGGEETSFEWDEDEGAFSMNGDRLNSEVVTLKYVNFEVFPDVDPYDAENATDDDLQFQPIVQVNMTFATPGRVREEVTLDFQTSVTSRFYQ